MNNKKELCACGKTKTPPYCDGSHERMQTQEPAPTLKTGAKRELCACGKTKTPPYCDGSHERTEEDESTGPVERFYYDLFLKRMERPTVTKLPISKKIVLTLLPVWSPLIPPQGIGHLKNFLQNYGYTVLAIDANSEYRFKQLTDAYFAALKKHIPENKLGNINNIGSDVLRDHMMAHINYENKEKYIELVKILVYKTFYWEAGDLLVYELIKALNEFYGVLGIFLADILEAENPEVFGISVFRDTLPTSLFVFRICREKFPRIKTVMGGGVFSYPLPPDTLNFQFFLEKTGDCIDKIIIGRGEIALLKYLRSIQPVEDAQAKEKEISFSFSSPRDKPDLSDFNLQRYYYHGAFGSTGCPYRCSFCNVEAFYGKYQKKDPRQTAAEMMELNRKYGARLFFMLDELLNPIISDLARELIKANQSLYWDGYFRIDDASANIENTHLWRRGGFYRARIGIESGSQRILNLMNKGITIPQIKAALTGLATAGIKTTLYVVIGHPRETEEDFRETLALMEDIKNYTWEAECNPFTYFYTGQHKADKWEKKRILLYPEWAKDMLITQTWIVEGIPSREELFDRVCRFTQHCKKLGIASPWSLIDIYNADQRWKKLHENAVPTMLEFENNTVEIDENKKLEKLIPAQGIRQDNQDFMF
jgi:CDGSH-type Zn-finger protein